MAQYPIGSRKDGGKILNGPETEGHRPGAGGFLFWRRSLLGRLCLLRHLSFCLQPWFCLLGDSARGRSTRSLPYPGWSLLQTWLYNSESGRQRFPPMSCSIYHCKVSHSFLPLLESQSHLTCTHSSLWSLREANSKHFLMLCSEVTRGFPLRASRPLHLAVVWLILHWCCILCVKLVMTHFNVK